MNAVEPFVRVTLTLGVITLIGLVLSSLALIDIYVNMEPDLTNEWNTVWVSLFMTALFIFASLRILWRIRTLPKD